jgi:signal transduction histidine kinase
VKRITFKTRARTIDHLGRGQIADAPTAVSELWKNAYDAYARNVDLHIFDGAPEVAAIMDDGFGMDRDDFIERWLVIGTESKIDGRKVTAAERFGLAVRQRQGEKGIGRLSAAFLAPVNLIVSKKHDSRFAAALVDWRLFENPFLSLDDIALAVEEFDTAAAILKKLPAMAATLRENLHGENGPADRAGRLTEGWQKFSHYERSQGTGSTTEQKILGSDLANAICERHMNEWAVTLGLVDHGTALFLIEIHRELAVWVDPTRASDDEVTLVKERLLQTLTGFTDPYTPSGPVLNYEVLTDMNSVPRRVLGALDVFGLDDLRSLEHAIEGSFADDGTFTGNLRAFGVDRGQFQFRPQRPPPTKGADRLGAFDLCIGTFEQTLENSTHDEQTHTLLEQQAKKFSGLGVYRDGLRVMPYGRPDADFFRIEERRGKHAGREFWAHRRTFGRVAFTHRDNPNLRDKAGREGLIDNRARREMQLLVRDFLMEIARRFFGTDSDLRQADLPEIQARNRAAKEATEKARRAKRKTFRTFLHEHASGLRTALEQAKEIQVRLSDAEKRKDHAAVRIISDQLDELDRAKESLRPPPLPPRLGEKEEEYRRYRDGYTDLVEQLQLITRQLNLVSEALSLESPSEIASARLAFNAEYLTEVIDGYLATIQRGLSRLDQKWRTQAAADAQRYHDLAEPLISDLDKGGRLATVLESLDSRRAGLQEELSIRYDPFLRTLDQLLEDIDIDSAFAVTEYERSALEQRVGHFLALAQIGISVEIIGHELETLDAEVARHLRQLPKDVQLLKAYKLAFEAHRALVDRLRFLAPMKVAGYRAREVITGSDIATYVEDFFARQFAQNGIAFTATAAFKRLRVTDLPSRIYPVFINLINNSVYWLAFSEERKIKLDFADGKVVVADSGPGVDQDDVGHLFELFYTRRSEGRGVGLYLSKMNLAVAHHSIHYASPTDPRVLNGANFIIEFRGIQHD